MSHLPVVLLPTLYKFDRVSGCALLHQTRLEIRIRAGGFWPPHRPEPGHPISDRAGLCRMESSRYGHARAATAMFQAGLPCGGEANTAIARIRGRVACGRG